MRYTTRTTCNTLSLDHKHHQQWKELPKHVQLAPGIEEVLDQEEDTHWEGTAEVEAEAEVCIRELLDNLSVARARGGSVFYLTPVQWDAVLERTGAWQAEAEDEDLVEAIVSPKGRGKSQGTGLDAASRKAVELRAMLVAEEH